MKTIITAAAMVAFALVPVACKESPEGGSPGTTSSFKLTRIGTDPTLKPGETKTIEIKLDRGSDFNREVNFDVKAPAKIKAEIDPKDAKEGQSPTLNLKLTAEPDAPDGEHKVTVTGTPTGGGSPTSLDITATVRK